MVSIVICVELISPFSSNLLEKTTDVVIKAAKTGDLLLVRFYLSCFAFVFVIALFYLYAVNEKFIRW